MPFSKQVFVKGDRVAWDHGLAIFSVQNVLVADAAQALYPDASLGTVTGCANAEKTYYDVALDDGGTVTLTYDELVKVADA